MNDDRDLVARLISGDVGSALQEIGRHHGRMIERTARRLTGDGSLAEDVMQGVFLVLVRKAPTLRSLRSLGPWLYRVTVLASQNVRRMEKRRQRHEKEVAKTMRTQPEPANLPDGLDQALDRLPAAYREVLVLRYLESRSRTEVAAALGVDEGTVDSRTSRGLDRLRGMLAASTAGLTVAALELALVAEASASAAASTVGAVACAQTVAGGTLKAAILSIADGSLKTMAWMPVKAAALLLCAGTLLGGAAWATHRVLGQEPPTSPSPDSALKSRAAAMQPGEWAELRTEGFGKGNILVPPGGTGNGGILEYSDEAHWNPVKREVYVIGTQRGYTDKDHRWVKYSEAANAWTVQPPLPFHPGYHNYDHAALDPATGDFYQVTAGKSWRHSGGTWTELPTIPISVRPDAAAAEFFPELGGVVFQNGRNNGELWLYKAGAWRKIAAGFSTGELHNVTIYSPKRKILFFGGGDDSTYYPGNQSVMMYALDAEAKVTRLPDAPAAVGVQTSVNTVDPVTGNLLVFSKDRNIYEYDPEARTWSPYGRHELLHRYKSFACGATPISEYGVILFVKFDYDDSKILLYKPPSKR